MREGGTKGEVGDDRIVMLKPELILAGSSNDVKSDTAFAEV